MLKFFKAGHNYIQSHFQSMINRFLYRIVFASGLILCSISPAHGLTNDPADAIDETLSRLHDFGLFNGVVLAADGDDIIYHEAFGTASFEWDIPNTTDTRFKIASITKSFTANLVLCLVEADKLALDDVITDFLPDYPAGPGNRITIEQLLVQTAGIPDYLELPGFLEEKAIHEHDRYEFVKHFSELELEFEPGTDWNYGNSGYYLLGLIIEQASGLTYEEALQKYILEPAGLEDTGYAATGKIIERLAEGYERTPAGYERAPFFHSSAGFSAGMMYSTAKDLFKWTRALFDGLLLEDQEYLQNMVTPQKEDYGYGVFIGSQRIGSKNDLVVSHSGNIHGFSSQLTYFAFSDYTLIILDNTKQCTSRTYFALRDLLFGLSASVEVREPVSHVLGSVIEQSGIEEAILFYSELREERGDECDFSLSEFIRLGDFYLERGQPETAQKIFELAITLYPETSRLEDRLEKIQSIP